MTLSLRAKIIGASALLLIFLVSLYAVFQVRMATQDLERQTERLRTLRVEAAQAQGTQAVLAVASSSHFWIADNDFTALDGQLKPVVEEARATDLPIAEALITDHEGEVLASSRARQDRPTVPRVPEFAQLKELTRPQIVMEGAPLPTRVRVVAPIRDDTGRLWGFTRFIYELEGLRKDLEEIEAEAVARRAAIWQRAGLIGLLVVALGVLVAVLQALAITRPIVALSRSANRIAEGDLSTRVAVATRDEIGTLASNFNHMADRIEGLLAETAAKMALEKELEVARIIQETLLPGQGVVERPGVRFAGAFRSASTCGGDFWTHADLAGGRLMLAVGDVTGHGVPSAMITAACRSGIDTLLSVSDGQLDAPRMMAELNTTIHSAAQRRFFMTFFAVVLDASRRRLHFANAGHNFPILVRRQPSGRWKSRGLVARGSRLGDVLGSTYEPKSVEVGPGDLLCLYTDGITEYRNAEGQEFGERRLRRLLERAASGGVAPDDVVAQVMAEVEAFAAGEVQEDDITLVVARFA
ncbi:MAG: hypothetical protein CMH57_11720 [Myxococcales bacterium]|nr:hypothetical protein [Myxococcales bacterium]